MDALGEMMLARRSMPAAALTMMVVAMFLLTGVGTALGQDKPTSREDEWVPTVVQQEDGIPPQITPYYVKATSGPSIARGQLDPTALELNDTLAEIQVPGPTFPRRTLTRAGIFELQVSLMKPLEVYGINLVSVWAKSNEDAQNAEFRVLFQRNGGTVSNMYTNRAMLSSVPLEFTVPDPPTFTEPVTFNSGDTMSIEIQYRASSRYLVGPAPSCILLANSIQHATRIELMAHPIDANVSAPIFKEDKLVHINGKIWDTYAVDPATDLKINLEIVPSGTGTIPAGTIERMNFNPRESEIIINWTWNYKKSQVTNGLFEFRIDVSYGVTGHNYTNSSFYELEFPKTKDDSGGILSGSNAMYLGIVGVLVVAGVAVAFWRRSRTPYPPYMAAQRPQRPKKKKMSKKDKKAMMRAKQGVPPPGSPRSPDRTPMPGRGPPSSGAPPPRAPGAPRGAPRPGSARPGSAPPPPRR